MNPITRKLKRIPRKERNIYLLIALAVVIIAAGLTYGPIKIPGLTGRSSEKLQAWCSVAKDNMDGYKDEGLTCGLWREDVGLISLADAASKYEKVYCSLLCYDCATEGSPRGIEVCNADSTQTGSDTDKIAIDQDTMDTIDSFVISWAETPPATVYRNEEVKLSLKVRNPDQASGEMKVQCSLLDPKVHTFLGSVAELPTANCVKGESFTQTKIVKLSPGSSATVTFAPVAPNEIGTYRYFCEAFERCYVAGEDYYPSSTLKDTPVEVVERPDYKPVVDSDSISNTKNETKTLFGWNFDMGTPFADWSAWWGQRNVLQKFLMIFGAVFLVLIIFMSINEKKPQGGYNG